MKKLAILTLAALAIFMQSCSSSKNLNVKELVAQYTAEGYKTQSMAYSMTESMTKFRDKLQSNKNFIEIISDGSGASSFAAEMEALNAAGIKYATQAGSVIRGGMEREFGSLGNDYDKFHGTYVQNVAKFIMPMMRAEMTFVKKEQNTYHVRIGYIIDEEQAKEARHNALNETLKEQAAGQVFGENARKFVDETVRPEE